MIPPRVLLTVGTALAVGAALLVGTGCARSTPAPAGPLEALAIRIDSLAPEMLREHDVPGLAVVLVEDGEVVHTRGFGWADREARRPMTAQTVFNVASVSKPVTAWGVLRLASSGTLSLDAPVGAALQSWGFPPSAFDADSVTVRRLLSHTAGTSLPSAPWFPADSALPSLTDVLRGGPWSTGVVLEWAPGERWGYSGGGYLVLQQAVEDVTGHDFATYMDEEVFAPLGMERTSFAPVEVVGEGVATPYDEDGQPIPAYRVVGAAAGGLHSTAEDFARFLTAYARRGDPVLSPETFRTLREPVAPVTLDAVEGAEYGLGHGVHRTSSGETILYHSGGNPGYVAYFLVAPERGDGLAVFANSLNAVPTLTRLVELWGEATDLNLQPVY